MGRRSTLRAVDGVSFDLPRGLTLGVVGETGCGKSTLGRSILHLVRPTGGQVWFDGVDVLAASRSRLRRLRRDMQLVFQDPNASLDPRMTVGASITEPLVIFGAGTRRARAERAAELLDRVGLPPSIAQRYPHELSGGQRQRVCIARAIALSPKFMVCDEPVSALDVSVQAQVLNLLVDLQHELGLTYLFISHNLAVVEHVSDLIAVMYLGRIVESAPTAELIRRAAHPYTRALFSAVPKPEPTGRQTQLVLIGDPPDPARPPTGCGFHPRCPHATEECRRVTPRLETKAGLTPAHWAACHHAEHLARNT
jgi:oligopeptide/dipeptide ABC transporter ATP-binding protein